MKPLITFAASVALFGAFSSGLAIGGLFGARSTADAATAAGEQRFNDQYAALMTQPMTTGQIIRRERDDCERVFGPGAEQCKESIGHD